MGKLLRFCLFSSICTLIFTITGCGSAVSTDDGGLNSSGNSPHADDQVIIQTRLDGEHLDVFTLGQPLLPDVSPHVFTQEERARDYLAGRSDSTLDRNINGNIYRYPINWNMSTDQGTTTGSRVSLDGGDGAYITDYAVESVAGRVNLPTADGTYYYDLAATNTSGYGPVTSRHTYTRSGNEATITWRDPAGNLYLLYSGAPLASYTIGFGFLVNNTFGAASESVQDSRYTGTWTVTQNLNGIEGTTGQFDLRRIGITNLQVTPAEFNPAASEETTITGDVVALPTSTELTPNGWSPSGPVNWRIEIKDPLAPANDVRVFTGSSAATSPNANGKVAGFSQTWDGADAAGETLLNATYPIRAQATGDLVSGNILSKEISSEVGIGNKAVLIKNLSSSPERFDPEEGETTTLSFTIEAVGFENPNLSWTVNAYLGEQLVKEFPTGEALGTTTKDVSFQWDGKDETGIPVQGEVEYRIRATACDNEVLARLSSPVQNRALFQTNGGVCTFEDEVALVVTGSNFLKIEVSPNTVLPSRMYSRFAELNEVEVTVTLLEMPDNISSIPIELTVEVVDDIKDPTRPPSTNPMDPEPPAPLPPNLSAALRAQGGHAHDHSTRPKETFTKDNHTFEAPGTFKTKLQVTEVGSLLRVKATPTKNIIVNGSAIPPATTTLDVKVPNLVRLVPRPISSREFGYVLTGGAGIDNQLTDYGDITTHPSNHWGNPLMLSTLEEVGLAYMNAKLKAIDDPDFVPTTWEKILVNDISLPRGGVFDVSKTPNWSNPHAEHRDGTVVDARTERSGQDEDFKNLWIEATGLTPEIEGDHLHLRIQGGYAQ